MKFKPNDKVLLEATVIDTFDACGDDYMEGTVDLCINGISASDVHLLKLEKKENITKDSKIVILTPKDMQALEYICNAEVCSRLGNILTVWRVQRLEKLGLVIYNPNTEKVSILDKGKRLAERNGITK